MMKGPRLFLATLGLLFAGSVSAAPLTNGDFASFDGWSGDRYSSATGLVSTLVDEAELGNGLDTDDNFQRNASAGTGTAANSFDYYIADLYQEFDLPSTGIITLALEYAWELTNSLLDEAYITLFGTTDLLDIVAPGTVVPAPVIAIGSDSGSGTVTVDVTAFAGETVILSALVGDGDFNEADSVTIGNIEVRVAEVPVLPTALLLLGGLPLIVRRASRRAS